MSQTLENNVGNDKATKAILKENWTMRIWAKWLIKWKIALRWQPVNSDEKETSPIIKTPGTKIFRTQPDWLWFSVSDDYSFCDLLVIEDSSTKQNLNDKRSRYIPSSHSLVLTVNKTWLDKNISKAGGWSEYRWRALWLKKTIEGEKIDLPIRYMRVIYSLWGELYEKVKENIVPTWYESYVKRVSMKSFTSQKFQNFLQYLAWDSAYYSNKNFIRNKPVSIFFE